VCFINRFDCTRDLLLCICVIILFPVKAAGVTITGPTTVVFPQDNLVITCNRGSSPSPTNVYVITLNRNNTHNSPGWTEIAKVNSNGAVISNSDLNSRATITGTVSPVSSAQLKLTIQASDVKCTDAVAYQCVLAGAIPGTASYTDTAEKSIGIQGTCSCCISMLTYTSFPFEMIL